MNKQKLNNFIYLDNLSENNPQISFIELNNENGKTVCSQANLKEYVFNNKINSFFIKIYDEKYSKFNISSSDVLLIETHQKEFLNKKYVLVQSENELSIKQYRIIDETNYLLTPNGIFLPFEIEDYIKYEIIGVISKIIHNV